MKKVHCVLLEDDCFVFGIVWLNRQVFVLVVVTVMAPLSAYLISEPLGLTLGSQCSLETVKMDLLLKNFYFVQNQWFSCFKDYFSFPISQHNILTFWQPTPKLAETNAESVETETTVSNSLERFLFLLLLDVPPMTSRAGMISLPKCVGIYTKLKLVHGLLDVHHSCTSLLSFTFKNNFLNFVNSLEKYIS